MSENFLAALGGGLAAVLLILLVVRTVLAEVHAGAGGPAVRRTVAVRVLDAAGVLLMLVLLAVLAGRMVVALH